LPPLYVDFAPSRSGEVICDQLTTLTVTHPRSVRPAIRGDSLGWQVDSSVTNNRGIPVAVIDATEPVRDAKGNLGIQWTLRGAYEACDKPARQRFFDRSFSIRIEAKPRSRRVYCWGGSGGEWDARLRVKPARFCLHRPGAEGGVCTASHPASLAALLYVVASERPVGARPPAGSSRNAGVRAVPARTTAVWCCLP
jgi:hypothetical protein